MEKGYVYTEGQPVPPAPVDIFEWVTFSEPSVIKLQYVINERIGLAMQQRLVNFEVTYQKIWSDPTSGLHHAVICYRHLRPAE